MKSIKSLFALAIVTTLGSCGNQKGEDTSTAVEAELETKINETEEVTKKLDQSMKELESEVEETSSEVDSLLNDI